MIQVAVKPLTRLGLNTYIVMCLRDNRHLEYRDSIIGAVQAGLNVAQFISSAILTLQLE